MFHPRQQIGPYILITRLGKGGFGEVWLAEKSSQFFTKKVAVKLPHDEQVDLEAIRQEATLWEAASGHANVLPIIDADVYDGQVVIVSEYASDGSLADRISKSDGVPVKQAVEFSIGILSGLDYLHKKKIIHRDIKPQNVLLQGDTPRLADFGISRAMLTTSISSVVAGTDAYMSPESFDGKRNVQTDIWSVGVVLYQMLSGILPFPQEHPSERMFAILTKDFEPLSIEIPTSLRKVVDKALAKEPANRYSSAVNMRDDLNRVLTGSLKPDPAATEVLRRGDKRSFPTELLQNEVANDLPVPPTYAFFPVVEETVQTHAQAEDTAPALNDRAVLSKSSRTNRVVKILAAGTIGLVLVAAALIAINRMSGIGTASLNSSQPETTPLTPNTNVTRDEVPIVSPTPSPSPSPTPTPQQNGRYVNGEGQVYISGANERGFSFKINIATKGGIGEVEGKAVWIRPSVAVFSQIPDTKLYNDPESSFYLKKCRLTFRFVSAKLTVTEDEFGCTYWHGASVEFRGTYTK